MSNSIVTSDEQALMLRIGATDENFYDDVAMDGLISKELVEYAPNGRLVITSYGVDWLEQNG